MVGMEYGPMWSVDVKEAFMYSWWQLDRFESTRSVGESEGTLMTERPEIRRGIVNK